VFLQIPTPYIYSATTALLTAVIWLLRIVWKFVSATVNSWSEKLSTIESTTRVQAENHLCTIQANTTKANDLLEQLLLSQAGTNGFLKAIVEKD